MPFARPTLDELRAQAQADLAAALPGADPLLPVSNLGILADMLAEAASTAMYGYLDWIARRRPVHGRRRGLRGLGGAEGRHAQAGHPGDRQATFAGASGTSCRPARRSARRRRGLCDHGRRHGRRRRDSSPRRSRPVAPARPARWSTGVALVISRGRRHRLGRHRPPARRASTSRTFDAFRTRTGGLRQPAAGRRDRRLRGMGAAGSRRHPRLVRAARQGPGTVVVYFMMDVAEAAFGGFPQGTNGVAAAETRDAPPPATSWLVAELHLSRCSRSPPWSTRVAPARTRSPSPSTCRAPPGLKARSPRRSTGLPGLRRAGRHGQPVRHRGGDRGLPGTAAS
jgi:hypothetical protein